MSEKNTAQAHTTGSTQNNGIFGKVLNEGINRMSSFYDEANRFETKWREQASVAVDEGARMMKETFSYAHQISAEWRRLSLEAARRATELMGPRS